jgi:hypothetical protein
MAKLKQYCKEPCRAPVAMHVTPASSSWWAPLVLAHATVMGISMPPPPPSAAASVDTVRSRRSGRRRVFLRRGKREEAGSRGGAATGR